MVDFFRPYLSKLKFAAGLQIKVEKTSNFQRYIPPGKKSVILISADFELAWAWRYTKSARNALEKALNNARQERINVPGIVQVCDQYNIPITWATVGHLFLSSCQRKENVAHPDLPRIDFPFENKYWKFSGNDWYEYDPCTDLHTDPEWYCPDLISIILNSKVNHEIGCHTFSHIDCRDDICPPALLRAELKKCKELASEFNVELRSFIHPGHTIGNLDVIWQEGFTNFRTDYGNVLGYPKQHPNGLWEFRQTAEFALRKGWSIEYHINRYKKIIQNAINSNTVCVFWFHPSFDPVIIDKVWPEVFSFINENRDNLWVATHSEYVQWLNSNEKK